MFVLVLVQDKKVFNHCQVERSLLGDIKAPKRKIKQIIFLFGRCNTQIGPYFEKASP